ncbi:MAG: AAA family ATPase, partial [Verrucomicrobiota bacterium]|nr:AAA family ATPase [Verrucomicrobiota bacterium]
SENICRYITDICECARRKKGLLHAVSSRAAISLMRASQAAAWLEGNEAVYPDNVKAICGPVLSHRIGANESVDPSIVSGIDMVEDILSEVNVP